MKDFKNDMLEFTSNIVVDELMNGKQDPFTQILIRRLQLSQFLVCVVFLSLPLEGVAVGCGWQTFVAYVNVGCYYVVGVPVGALLGFYFNLGAKVITDFTFP